MAVKWKTVGYTLGLQYGEIESIANSKKTDLENVIDVFVKWLENAALLPFHENYPKSWKGLYNLLIDCEFSEIALALKEALNSESSSVRTTHTPSKFKNGIALK